MKEKKVRNKIEEQTIESLLDDDLRLTMMPIILTTFYALFNILWILFSDKILNIFVENKSILQHVQTIKGFIYIIITSLIIYILNSENTKKRRIWTGTLKQNYQEIQATYEQLIAAEEELRAQYIELHENQVIIEKSEERYKLALEGC